MGALFRRGRSESSCGFFASDARLLRFALRLARSPPRAGDALHASIGGSRSRPARKIREAEKKGTDCRSSEFAIAMPSPPGADYPRLAISVQKKTAEAGLRVAELRLRGDLELHRAEPLGAQSPRYVANDHPTGAPAHGRDGERITLLQCHPNLRFRLIEYDGHDRRIRAEGEQVLRPAGLQLKADSQVRFGLLERQNPPRSVS